MESITMSLHFRNKVTREEVAKTIENFVSGQSAPSSTAPAMETTPSRASTALGTGKLRRRTLAVAGVVVALLLMAAGYAFRSLFRPKASVQPFQNFVITRVTDTGKSIEAAISPDGRYILSVVEENGKRGLFLRHLPTNSNTQVITTRPEFYSAPTFSPDGNYFYFLAAKNDNTDVYSLLRAPVLGGTPQLVAQNVAVRVSFSPDAKRIVYARQNSPEVGKFQIFIAEPDGSNEKVLTTIPQTDVGYVSFENLAWSPDGNVIALTANPAKDPLHRIMLIDAASGQSRSFALSQDRLYGDVKWAPDVRGLYVMYSSRNTGFDRWQIGYISVPSGEFGEVTRDTNYYVGLSLPADGRTIATAQGMMLRSFFLIPITGTTTKQPVSLLRTEKAYRYWTVGEAGEIYVAGPGKLMRVTLAGQQTTDLLNDARGYFLRPQVCWSPDASGMKKPRYIVFELYGHGVESGADRIWRINPDGSNPFQLSSGNRDTAPACSPDGNRVFYIDSDSNQIKQVPVEGGTPEVVPGSTIAGTFLFQHLGFSPDGGTLAVAVTLQHKEHSGEQQHKIALIPLNAGTNPTLRLVDPDPRISDYAMFTQDGNTLLYAITDNGVGNLWAQPIKGGLGHQITNFSSELIGYYQLSGDGKSLLLHRRHIESDIVLLRDTAPQ